MCSDCWEKRSSFISRCLSMNWRIWYSQADRRSFDNDLRRSFIFSSCCCSHFCWAASIFFIVVSLSSWQRCCLSFKASLALFSINCLFLTFRLRFAWRASNWFSAFSFCKPKTELFLVLHLLSRSLSSHWRRWPAPLIFSSKVRRSF